MQYQRSWRVKRQTTSQGKQRRKVLLASAAAGTGFTMHAGTHDDDVEYICARKALPYRRPHRVNNGLARVRPGFIPTVPWPRPRKAL